MRAPTACKTISALGLAALMTACASSPPQAAAPLSVAGTVVDQPAAGPAAAAPMQPVTLASHDWELVSMTDRHGRADTRWRLPGQRPPRLHFEGGRLSVHNLCNVVSSGYQVQGNTMLLMAGAATKRACAEPELMELEQRMALYLGGPAGYELRSNAGGTPLLVLLFGDSTRWELVGTATPQTRYGGPGERVFLEVAPQRVPCGNPLMPAAQCLSVRELRFADNGVRQGAGQWQPFYGEIDGYTHEPGMRNVLRLTRYQLKQPVPADAASQAYVLDMVVESERLR